jgi:hypothetical protein
MTDSYSIYNPSYNTGDFPHPPQPPQPKHIFVYVPSQPYPQPAAWCGDCHNYKFACVCDRFKEPRPLRPEDV